MSKKVHKQATEITIAGSQSGLNGRYQCVPLNVAKQYPRTVLAAGAVVWRRDADGTLEIALVHRPHYDDWSLAKGKVDPGESLVVTAAREVQEETGLSVVMGKLLGHVRYPIGNRTKVVYYWTAQCTGGEFLPNKEVDELRWCSVDEALALLSYQVDREVVRKAAKRLSTKVTSRVILVRHGRAHRRANWAGDDNRRPLDKKGRRQAEMLAPLLQAYQPDRLFSAEPDRCQQTAAPTAQATGLRVHVDPIFGDEHWISAMTTSQARFEALIRTGGTNVVFSQGFAIPDVIGWLSAKGRLPLAEIKAKKGSVWVLDFAEDELVGADYLESALAVK